MKSQRLDDCQILFKKRGLVIGSRDFSPPGVTSAGRSVLGVGRGLCPFTDLIDIKQAVAGAQCTSVGISLPQQTARQQLTDANSDVTSAMKDSSAKSASAAMYTFFYKHNRGRSTHQGPSIKNISSGWVWKRGLKSAVFEHIYFTDGP